LDILNFITSAENADGLNSGIRKAILIMTAKDRKIRKNFFFMGWFLLSKLSFGSDDSVFTKSGFLTSFTIRIVALDYRRLAGIKSG
jgi:hypothetical protein